tara:strand:+ start:73650 stop:74258 length:609 start_codon:yes stop_codon:yes gene_type:complete
MKTIEELEEETFKTYFDNGRIITRFIIESMSRHIFKNGWYILESIEPKNIGIALVQEGMVTDCITSKLETIDSDDSSTTLNWQDAGWKFRKLTEADFTTPDCRTGLREASVEDWISERRLPFNQEVAVRKFAEKFNSEKTYRVCDKVEDGFYPAYSDGSIVLVKENKIHYRIKTQKSADHIRSIPKKTDIVHLNYFREKLKF